MIQLEIMLNLCLEQTSNISVTGGSGEGSTPTIDLIDAGPGAGTYGGANAFPILTLDAKGRVASVTTFCCWCCDDRNW